jgi:SPP1 gp7 family putative phage head morphogenesis protein
VLAPVLPHSIFIHLLQMQTDAKYQRKLSAAELRKRSRQRFAQARKVEKIYERQLSSIAKHVGALIKAFAPKGVVSDMGSLTNALTRYSDALRPWAIAVTHRMQAQVSQKDIYAWSELGRELGRSLQKEIQNAPTGKMMREMMAEQVHLITSLPIEAAKRVHKWTIEGELESIRASQVAHEILRSGAVTVGRAKLIARTEVARTSSLLTQTRAEHIGSTGYIWRTSKDTDVRDRHKKLEGKLIPWDDPPVAGERGERAHAGQIYNCRCWSEVVIPDDVRLAA